MILYTKCIGCSKEHKIKASGPTRGDLQQKYGDQLKINCRHCGKMFNAHLNKVKAKSNQAIIAGSFIVSILAGVAMFYYFWAAGTIVIAIPLVIWQQQEAHVRAFNRYKIKQR